MTAGAEVVWFGEGVSQRAYSEVEFRKLAVTTVAADGTARLELSSSVPRHSVWFVADLSTGSYAVGSPDGFTPPQLAVGDVSVAVNGATRIVELSANRSLFYGLAVRPGRGAWIIGGDNTIANGRTSATQSAVSVRHDHAAFGGFAATDVTFVVDPANLAYSVINVGALLK